MMRFRPPARAGTLPNEHDQLAVEAADLRRAVFELRMLNDVAVALAAADDLDSVLRVLVRTSLRAVGAEQGVITLVAPTEVDAPGAHTLLRTCATGTTQEAFRPNEAVLGWMQGHLHPLLVHEPATDPQFRAVQWPAGLRSLLAVPMLVATRLLGVLSLYNKLEATGFTDDDARLLTILAGQSALVVERARLVEERAAAEALRAEAEADRDRLVRAFGHETAPALVETIRHGGIEGVRAAFGLTPQEARVALLLSQRKTNREVAALLCISAHTAKRHTEQVFEKLGVHVRAAVQERLAEAMRNR